MSISRKGQSTDSGYVDNLEISTGQSGVTYDTLLKIKKKDVVDFEEFKTNKELIDTEKLYAASINASPNLSRAFSLLNAILEHIEDARSYTNNEDIIGTDNALLHVTELLRELFNCREIGDNFGTITSVAFQAFKKRDQGKLLTLPQLNKLHSIIRTLRSEPFMDNEKMITLVIELEDMDIQTDPNYIGEMMSAING